jgi:hypothetical protein
LLNFRALLSGRLNTENLRIYFCANPKGTDHVLELPEGSKLLVKDPF